LKTLIGILIVLSFFQSSVMPLDLVLIVLICRSYIRIDRFNLYLAFAFGLLDSHLNLNTLGIRSIIYLSIVQTTQIISKSRLTGNPFLIIPLSFILLVIKELLMGETPLPKVFNTVLPEALLSLPIFYIVRLWEERFIARKDIKLRV